MGQDVEKCLSLVLAALVLKSPQKLPSDLEVRTRRLPSFGGHLSSSRNRFGMASLLHERA